MQGWLSISNLLIYSANRIHMIVCNVRVTWKPKLEDTLEHDEESLILKPIADIF